MPAKLIESRPRPFKRVGIDTITLDIIENAMLMVHRPWTAMAWWSRI